VKRQREIVAELSAAGYPTGLAEELLDLLTATLEQMRVHRDYLEAEHR
jgi:hypothetical protein